MLSILATTGRLVASRWPQLLAWYLAGYLVHYVVIEIAGFVGATSALAGVAIMPLAIVARLASFIGMFFVLRHAMPAFQSLKDKGQVATDVPADTPLQQRMTDVLLIAILPFFAFYAAWRFLRDDTQTYAQVALRHVDFGNEPISGNVLDLQLTPITIGAIVLAFAVRFAIKKFESKLPRWSKLVAVYFEALWVYLVILILSDYITLITEWIGSRVAVQWIDGARDWLIEAVAPLAWLWSAIETAMGELGDIILLPLAWLTIAGVVYGRALAQAAFSFKFLTRFRPRVKLSKGFLRRLKELGGDIASRLRPVADAAVLIWRAGLLPIAFFVLCYTALEALEYWGLYGIARAIGPHELGWWFNVDDLLSFAAQILAEPLRIALIAAAYDFCLRRLEERRDAAALATATAPVAAAGTEATVR